VYTPQLREVRGFYEAGLGVAPANLGDWQPFELAGGRFALHGSRGEPGQEPARVHLTFVVDDIEAALRRFEAAGARVLRGVADEAFGKRAYVQDPDGREFELIQEER
jgi:predicted enzyme related to lactoylglutathione lyase